MSETVLGNLSASESNFTWDIQNFSKIETDYGKAIYSPTFTTYHCDEYSNKILNLHWRLKFYPNGGYVGFTGVGISPDYISVCVENLDRMEVSAEFSLALMNKLNSKIVFQCRSIQRDFGEKRCWGWHNFSKKEFVALSHNNCLVNDNLTVSCGIYSPNVICFDEESDEEDCSEALLKHYEMLFETGKFSDVTIKIQDQELHVHKSILSGLSPVFQAIFENQMKEQSENVVKIDDIEFDTIKEMLRFMYVRKVKGIEKIASNLFMAADIYCVKGLKKFCEKNLCKDFNMTNALQRLEMAVECNMKKLKRNSIKFIAAHLKSFNKQRDFKEISYECKTEILSYIAEKLGDGNEQLISP